MVASKARGDGAARLVVDLEQVKASSKNSMTIAEALSLPVTVPIVTAGRAFGLSRDGVYDLKRRGAFPCRTITVGRATVVPRAELFRVLGITEDGTSKAA